MVLSEVTTLLDQHPSLVLDKERQRVKCAITSHEMPLTPQAIQSYVNGKKYQKASEMLAFDFDKHKKHIVPSNKRNHLHEMFCTLTLRHIQKTPQSMQRHITGRKYTNALARWLKCQETGEKFTPHVRRKGKLPGSFKANRFKKDGPGSFDDSDDDRQSDQDSDNMSDLYPDEDDEADDDDDEEEEDDDDDEEDSEEELEEPVPVKDKKKETKTSKKRKKREEENANVEEDSDSDSDYHMDVLDSARKSVTKATDGVKPGKKRKSQKSTDLPETNGLTLTLKRKSQENDSTSQQRKKGKKKKTKKTLD